MEKVFILIVAVSLAFVGCKKNEIGNTEKENENVYVNITINEDLLKTSSGDDYFYSRRKPDKYYVYFIADDAVVTEYTIEGKGDRVMVPEREYDLIVVSSIKRGFSDGFTEQKILTRLPYESGAPNVIGFLRKEKVERDRTIEVSVGTPYAAVLIFSSESIANVDIKADYNSANVSDGKSVNFGTTVLYWNQQPHYKYHFIKNHQSEEMSEKWSMTFTIKGSNFVKFVKEELESGYVYLFTVDEATGDYEKEVEELIWID